MNLEGLYLSLENLKRRFLCFADTNLLLFCILFAVAIVIA